MPEALVTRGRAATLTGLRAQRLSVGVRLSALMDELRFPDHPWRAPPQGTEATIAALEPGEVRAHLAGLREKARLLVVVVGDVEPGEVISQLDAQFGALPRGAGVGRAPLAPFTAAGVASEAGEQTTTRVRVLCRASHPASDGAASLVGSYLLWSRLFFRMPLADSTEYLWEMDATAGWAGFEFSSTRPAEALKAAWGQVRELQDRVFSEYDLATARTSSELRLLRARETTSEQAQGLGAALLDSGDWRIERRRLERLRTVSAEEVSAWATRCFANAKVVSVGPVQLEPADVPPW
jgi:predicted Zn-dependent peptidase